MPCNTRLRAVEYFLQPLTISKCSIRMLFSSSKVRRLFAARKVQVFEYLLLWTFAWPSSTAAQQTEYCSHPNFNQESCLLSSETWEAVLLTDLFGTDEQNWNGTAPYSASVRPARPVLIDTTLWRLIPTLLDDAKETLDGQLAALFRWNDPFLRWDPAQYGGIEILAMTDTSKVWVPNIMIDNMVENFADSPPSDYGLNVYPDGTVSLNMPISFSVICRLNVADFPFDKQNCDIIVSGLFRGLPAHIRPRLQAISHPSTPSPTGTPSPWVTYLQFSSGMVSCSLQVAS